MATKKQKLQETGSFSCSSRKEKTLKCIPVLPPELVFRILCHLPAHVLNNLRGRICRSWDVILRDPTFVETHLSLATNHSVLLIIHYHHLPALRNSYQFLESCGKFRGDSSGKLPGRAIASSGGVVLCSSREIIHGYGTHTEEEDLHVVNPATQQVSKLPCFSSSSSFAGDTAGFIVSLIPNTSFPIVRLAPFSAGGVVYWVPGCWTTEPSIMATDLRGETTSALVRVQDNRLSHQEAYKVVPMGDFACVLELDPSLRSGNIRVLKDLYRSEWEWFYKFDATPEVHTRMCFNSTAWLELDDDFQVVLKERVRNGNGELLLTGYDFKTEESKVFFSIHSTNATVQQGTSNFEGLRQLIPRRTSMFFVGKAMRLPKEVLFSRWEQQYKFDGINLASTSRMFYSVAWLDSFWMLTDVFWNKLPMMSRQT